jgi:hypothetical protein
VSGKPAYAVLLRRFASRRGGQSALPHRSLSIDQHGSERPILVASIKKLDEGEGCLCANGSDLLADDYGVERGSVSPTSQMPYNSEEAAVRNLVAEPLLDPLDLLLRWFDFVAGAGLCPVTPAHLERLALDTQAVGLIDDGAEQDLLEELIG